MGETLMPGRWLLALARVLFDEAVVASVVHPTIADLQREWSDADGRTRFVARFRGYVAFWSLVLIAPVAFRNWPDRSHDGRAFWPLTGLLAALLVVVIAWRTAVDAILAPLLNRFPEGTMGTVGSVAAFAYLLGPLTLAIAVAVGRFHGRERFGQRLPSLIFFSLLSIPIAALIGTAGIIGTFDGIGRSGSAGLGTVKDGIMAASEPMSYGLAAAALALLVCGVLAIIGWPVSTRAAHMQTAWRAVGVGVLLVASLACLDQLLREQHQMLNWQRVLLGPPESGVRGPVLVEELSKSIGLVLFGGIAMTLWLAIAGIATWRVDSRHPLLTWTTRAAVIVALVGSAWHLTVLRADVQALRDIFTAAQRGL